MKTRSIAASTLALAGTIVLLAHTVQAQSWRQSTTFSSSTRDSHPFPSHAASGHVYVQDHATGKIHVADLATDGSLGPWRDSSADLNDTAGRGYAIVVVDGLGINLRFGRVELLVTDATGDVVRIDLLEPPDGIGGNRYFWNTAVVADFGSSRYVWHFGGWDMTDYRRESETFRAVPSTTATWSWDRVGPPFPGDPYHAAFFRATSSSGFVYVADLGGALQRIETDAAGGIGVWTSAGSLPAGERGDLFVHGYFLYAVRGRKVYRAAIDPATGSLASWDDAPADLPDEQIDVSWGGGHGEGPGWGFVAGHAYLVGKDRVYDLAFGGAPPGSPRDDVLAGAGAGPTNPNALRVHRADGTPAGVDVTAFAAGRWGVDVASGDVDGGTSAEILAGPGPGAVFGPQLRGFDRSGTPLQIVNLYAYGTLRYGVNVTSGDLERDGWDEIVATPGPGTVFGPHVRGFDVDGGPARPVPAISFFAYATLAYGALGATRDVDGDGYAEIVTGPGPGPSFGAQVRGFDHDGAGLRGLVGLDFVAFAGARHGVRVAGADHDRDGRAEIVAAPGPGPTLPARVLAFGYGGGTVAPATGFDVTPFSSLYGAKPGAADVVGDDAPELLAGSGTDPTADSTVRFYTYDGAALAKERLVIVPFATAGYGVEVDGAVLGY